jgi:hypothetical protein
MTELSRSWAGELSEAFLSVPVICGTLSPSQRQRLEEIVSLASAQDFMGFAFKSVWVSHQFGLRNVEFHSIVQMVAVPDSMEFPLPPVSDLV